MIAITTPLSSLFSKYLPFRGRMAFIALCLSLSALHSLSANTITIQSPTGGSNVTASNDNLTVNIVYSSGGGGSQTPTWAYRIDSSFPSYGSPHGGTQVTGLTSANDILNGKALGTRHINVALLDQAGNLHNPPILQSVQVNYQSGGGGNQSGGGAWSVNPADYANNMTMSALVRVDGANATSGSLAAFVGSQIRGLNSSPTVVPMGAYQGQTIYSLVIYGDTSGQTLSFKWSSDGTGANAIPLTNAVGSPITYTINDNQGSATSPIIFEGISAGSISIASPANHSSIFSPNDNLSVNISYQSGGGGNQTPMWAYRINSPFPSYGSPHGGTQVSGSYIANGFLANESLGAKTVYVTLLDHNGTLRNPPVLANIQVNYQSSGGGNQSGGGGNQSNGGGSIVITSPGNGSNADPNTDLTVTIQYASGGGGYQTPIWAYRIDSGFPGYGSQPSGTQITGSNIKHDFLGGQPNGMRNVHVALLDQNGNLHNPPITASVQVNYQSSGGAYQSGGGVNQSNGGDSITITSPINQSSIYSHNDNLSVNIVYQSGGGGNQTPMWAYRINTPFPGYGSSHGGTQVNGSFVANDFLANQALGAKVVSVTLLDQNGNLRNPPMNQTVVVYYQSQAGGNQSGGGGNQLGNGGYTGPYQFPTGNFKIDTRNALFDDFIEFKGYQSVGKLKHDYNTSTYFNQSIDELINQLIPLKMPPSAARGDAVDAWIAANFSQSDSFDHHKTMQSFNYAVVASVDLNNSSALKALATNHGSIYFQVFVDQNVTASGKLQSYSKWALSIENGDSNRTNLIVDMAGKVYSGDFNSYWFNTYGVETWNNAHWHETSYSTSSSGIDSLLLAHPVIYDPKAEVHTIKPFDFISDGQVDLKSPTSLSVLAKDHKRIYFQQYYFPDAAHNQSTSTSQQPAAFDPLDLVAGQERDQGAYQSGSGGYQTDAGATQAPGMTYQSAGGGFIPYTGPYAKPTYDFKIDTRNALFDDFIESVGSNSVTKLMTDYNTTKAFNDSVNTLTMQLQGLASPPSTARGDAVDQWIKSSFDQVKDLDPNHEPAFAWALSIEDADGNKSDLLVDMFGNVYQANFESYWLAVYGVPTHNDPNWSEVEYNATSAGIAKLYQEHPFIDPGIVMENLHKLAVLTTDAPQIQGSVLQLSGSLLETKGGDLTRVGFLVSSQGHPSINDTSSQIIVATNQNSMISASYDLPNGGVYYVRSFAETKGGISEGPVRRIEVFLDSHASNDSQAKALSLIKEGTKELAGGWRDSNWFGLYLDHGNGWIYHQIHGYLYLAEDGNSGIWAYDQERKWFWSNKGLYPFIYQSDKAAWLYMLGVSNGKGVFFNYATNRVEF